MMAQYRKKPVVIEAVHYDEHAARYGWGNQVLDDNPWLDAAYDPGDILTNHQSASGERYIAIKTLEGVMRCNVGDWIIRGVKGELYSCRDDIFTATYEPVESSDKAERVE